MDESASQADQGKDYGAALPTSGLQRVEPEAGRAIYALSVAAELYESAEQKVAESSFEDSIGLSRDCMRLASSALLFQDGYIATDLDSSCGYLKKRYGGALPVTEWVAVEGMASERPADRILGIFGRGKGIPEQNAKKALESAKRFLDAASEIIRPLVQELAKEMSEEPGEEQEELSDQAEPIGQQDDEYGEAS
jgi:hypothetical protein